MATQITNQASLTYRYGTETGTALSNIATTVVRDPFSADKAVIDTEYRPGDELTYVLTFTNDTDSALSNAVIVDNLATYINGTAAVTPLTYRAPAYLYINGAESGEITAEESANSITFRIPTVPAGANVMVIYKAEVNNFASPTAGDLLTNDASFSADGINDAVTASASVPADAYADVNVIKEMTPNPVSDGGRVTYTFTIYNYGNTAADDVVLTDAFTPVPTNVTVGVNGVSVASDDYALAGDTLTLPTANSGYGISVPAATYTSDPATGEVSVSPGVTVVTVTGNI